MHLKAWHSIKEPSGFSRFKSTYLDLVYILGKGSTWGNNEIRYSLRSVEKNLIGYNQVFIIGECPPFLQNVIHIPYADIKGRPQFNIYSKLMEAVNDPRVSDPFIQFADDYFILQPTDVNGIYYYHNGFLSERIQKYGGNYRKAMQNSLEAGALYNYDIHTPFVYYKTLFKDCMQCRDWTKEYIIKSLYMGGLNFCYMEDCKINLLQGDLKKKLEGQRFLSTGLIGENTRKFLEREFPVKSRYEI